jgi:tRNA(Ile)-lysidine synthase
MDFLKEAADFIRANQLLEARQRLVAGVSGGPDSVCLLDCLVQLGYQPVPVYVDHGLRPESEQEARFVSRLAGSYGLEAIVRPVDVPGLLREQGGSLEEQARKARYGELFQVADDLGLDTIATAHQADDQIETVLLHVLRGSGLAGLRGMKPCTDLTGWFDLPYAAGKRLVRPLLEVDRQQILAYLTQRNLDYRTDASNANLKHRRNRVRHELLPYLQSFNPAIRSSLQRMSKIMADHAAWVEELVTVHWDTVVVAEEADQWVLDPQALSNLPSALQKELLRIVLSNLLFGDLEPDYGAIQAAVEFCRGADRRLTLAGGVRLERVADQVIVAQEGTGLRLPQYPQMMSDASEPLPVPGEIGLAGAWTLTSSLKDISDDDLQRWRKNPDPYRAALDMASLPKGLILRVRRPGDRLQPLGMGGTIKLSDLFINAGIPQPARPLWPVVDHGGEIVWVVGLHMADSCRLKESTKKAIVMQVDGPKNY